MISKLLAKQLHDVFFGGNWCVSTYKEHLENISLEKAKIQYNGLNSIFTLFVHTTYYINVLKNAVINNKLEGSDKNSFILPNIETEAQWQNYIKTKFEEVKELVQIIENLSPDQLEKDFFDPKYGTFFRNFSGIIEHFHYHLGQIVILKKII